MTIKYTPTSSVARPSKIYQNCFFFGFNICHLATLAHTYTEEREVSAAPQKLTGANQTY
jgi:hypothetical protein